MIPRNILELAAKVAEHAGRHHIRTKKDIPNWLITEGFRKVSCGASRGAVIGDKWVIKYPLNMSGFEELEDELEVFNSYVGTPDIEHLPHTELIRQGRALVLIQEAVKIDSKLFIKMADEIRVICQRFKMEDIHEGNIGFRKSGGSWVPVIIDLGEKTSRNFKVKAEESLTPQALNKFMPNASDSAFAEGMRRLGMNPDDFKKQTHRRMGGL